MTEQEIRQYVEGAFQALQDRGWFRNTGLVPTGVTEGEIADFEQAFGVRIPLWYKAFLQSYRMEYSYPAGFWGIVCEWDNWVHPMPLSLANDIQELRADMETFRDLAGNFFGADPEQYSHYLPIGRWDSDFLLWDLRKPEGEVQENDGGLSWCLVSFPHDEYWQGDFWDNCGDACAPDFKTLLDWCFYGTLIPEFEEDCQVKVTYERLNDHDFLWHYDEPRWKEAP